MMNALVMKNGSIMVMEWGQALEACPFLVDQSCFAPGA